MKSLIMKSVYAGLGVLSSSKENIEHLGRELAKRADLSEKEGEQVAKRLRARTERAITILNRVVTTEVKKVVDDLSAAAHQDVHQLSSKRRRRASRQRPR
jgi:polyhydroxyalkanoate synthesis regulator phasin